MAIGNFDKIVTFLVNNSTALGAGGKDGYTDLLTTRGKLRRGGGGRGVAYGDIEGNESFTLEVRKQSLLTSNLTMSLKARINGKIYTLQGWDEIEDKDLYYRINLTRQNG